MKTEHRAIIDRAKLLDTPPSMIAHELLVHDLVSAGLFELKNLHSPYGKLNEGQQQEVIDRFTEAATEAAMTAIAIISSRNVTTIPMMMKEVKFNSKQLTLTSIVDAKDPNRHDLIDSAGHLCLLVMAPDDYSEGLDFIQPDRDQPDLPLHVSDLTGSLFGGNASGPDEPDGFEHTTGEVEDGLYSQAVAFVLESRRATISAVQRKLKIGYNRAAELMNKMESLGVVSPMDHTGAREVMLTPDGNEKLNVTTDDVVDAGHPDDFHDGKEFGDFSYDDAKQLIVLKAKTKPFKAHWVQSRMAIDSDKAITLLLRLLDDKVVEVEAEGDSALEHSYKVIASLEDVV